MTSIWQSIHYLPLHTYIVCPYWALPFECPPLFSSLNLAVWISCSTPLSSQTYFYSLGLRTGSTTLYREQRYINLEIRHDSYTHSYIHTYIYNACKYLSAYLCKYVRMYACRYVSTYVTKHADIYVFMQVPASKTF